MSMDNVSNEKISNEKLPGGTKRRIPETLKIQIILRALTPIAHGAETFGNYTTAATATFRQKDGNSARVPIISADSLRHKMRGALANIFLFASGMLGMRVLTASFVRLLFNGGTLNGSGGGKIDDPDADTGDDQNVGKKSAKPSAKASTKTPAKSSASESTNESANVSDGDDGAGKKKNSVVNLDKARAMLELMPSLRLFGGVANTHMIEGQLKAENAYLLCDETREFWPEWVKNYIAENGIGIETYRPMIEIENRYRMDEINNPASRRLLSPREYNEQQQRLIDVDVASEQDDAELRVKSKTTMMPRSTETIVAGSLFLWGLTVVVYDELDLDTLYTALCAFLANAHVGGKSGTGHGRVEAVEARISRITHAGSGNAESVSLSEIGNTAGAIFRAHTEATKEELMKFADTVQA